jgi:hypothetical protein
MCEDQDTEEIENGFSLVRLKGIQNMLIFKYRPLFDHIISGYHQKNEFVVIYLFFSSGLQELDLCGCNRITDVSLKYAFSFLELQHLNLSLCQQVSVISKFKISFF